MKNLYYILKDYEKLKKAESLKLSKLIKILFVVIMLSILLTVIFWFLGYRLLAVFAFAICVSIIVLRSRKYEMYSSMFGTLSKIDKGMDIEVNKTNANKKRESGGFFVEKIKKIKENNKIKIFNNLLQCWEKILLEDAELMRKQSDEMADAVPEWFEYFWVKKELMRIILIY